MKFSIFIFMAFLALCLASINEAVALPDCNVRVQGWTEGLYVVTCDAAVGTQAKWGGNSTCHPDSFYASYHSHLTEFGFCVGRTTFCNPVTSGCKFPELNSSCKQMELNFYCPPTPTAPAPTSGTTTSTQTSTSTVTTTDPLPADESGVSQPTVNPDDPRPIDPDADGGKENQKPTSPSPQEQAIMITQLGTIASLNAGNPASTLIKMVEAQQACEEFLKSGKPGSEDGDCAINDPTFLREQPAATVAAEAEKATGLSREELASILDRISRQSPSSGVGLLNQTFAPLSALAEKAKMKEFRESAQKILAGGAEAKKKVSPILELLEQNAVKNEQGTVPKGGSKGGSKASTKKDSKAEKQSATRMRELEEIQKMLTTLSQPEETFNEEVSEAELPFAGKAQGKSLFQIVHAIYMSRAADLILPSSMKKQVPARALYKTVCPPKGKDCILVLQ